MTLRGPIVAPWRAPDPRVAITSQDGVASDLLLTTLSGPPAPPPPGLQYDWPLPVAPAFAVTLRTWTTGYNPNLVGQDQLFGAPGQTHPYDWPVPSGYPFQPVLRSWASPLNPNLPPAAAIPVAQYDWPLPIAPAFAVALRSWTASYNRNLIGKDRIFGAPGETHPYDWPVPRGYIAGLARNSQDGANRLLNLYAGAPAPVRPQDWPLPGRYADAFVFGASLRTWAAFYPQILTPRSRGYVID